MIALLAGRSEVALARAPSSDTEEKLFIDDGDTLQSLESQGFAFASLFPNVCAEGSSTESLQRAPNYRRLISTISLDIKEQELILREKTSVNVAKHLDVFPSAWLSSPYSRFELVGLTLRPDRSMQDPDTCGEFRLLYRLRFDRDKDQSRLPMTLMLEYNLARKAEGCSRSWQKMSDSFLKLRKSGGGKLDRHFPIPVSQLYAFNRVKVNLQITRLPQFKKAQILSQGHYLLRSFERTESGDIIKEELENTIDAERLSQGDGAGDLSALKTWIAEPENLQKIDRGDVHIPARFLSDKAISVVPYGTSRSANRPASRVLKEEDFAALDLSSFTYIKSPAALLRRLDSLSCQGCHVSRSVAGFHFLGGEPKGDDTFNGLKVSFSNHFREVQPWREAFLERNPKKFDFAKTKVPPPERSNPKIAMIGQHCAISDDPGFADWTCGEGLQCNGSFPKTASAKVGICVPLELDGRPGQVCDRATMVSDPDSLKDRLVDNEKLSCGPKGRCGSDANGFPNGKCFQKCTANWEGPDNVCGPSPQLYRFGDCLKTGKTFRFCAETYTNQALHAACSRTEGCLDDYVCASVPKKEAGACVPSYTLPQLLLSPHSALTH